MLYIVDLVADRARTHTFEQGCYARGVAQASAVVHVVGTKGSAHQLLKQVGLFVATFGRTKTGQSLFAVRIAQVFQTAGRIGQRFVPGRFAKDIGPVRSVTVQMVECLGVFGHTGLANQRHGQALRAVRVVKTEATFHAQATVVGRAIATVHTDDDVVLDVVGQQATHTAKRANRIHLFVDDL